MRNRVYIHLGSRAVGRLGNQLRKLTFMHAVCQEYPYIGFVDLSTVRLTEGLANFRRVAVIGKVDPGILPWHTRTMQWLIDRFPSRFIAVKICRLYLKILRKTLEKVKSPRYLYQIESGDYHYDAEKFLSKTADRDSSASFYADYLVYAPELMRKHATACRAIFEFDPDIEQRASELVEKVRMAADWVVGIPIRLTDYRTYRGGQFCVEVPRVREYMQAVLERHPGESVAFIVTCDERLADDAFSGFNVTRSTGTVGGSGGVLDAIAQLSRCDYLVGAVSTLAMSMAMKGGIDLFLARKSGLVQTAFSEPVVLYDYDIFNR